ncbi:MAG: universal stress protein [Bacteroidia bacterium]|nr:universal stress protein [Bacteroidia bacterium]MDW8332781.1 universal stress protein [Bacteroidia bacterium]
MKAILSPTDFSANAAVACRYAVMIAEKFGAKLTVYHAYHIKPGNPFTALDEVAKMEQAAAEKARKDLEDFIRRELTVKNVEVESVARMGLAVEDIVEFAEQHRYDLIVMGTRGADSLETKLLGTNSTAVLAQSRIPVAVIPMRDNVKSFAKILFAADLQPESLTALPQVVDFARRFKAKLVVLHVSTENEKLDSAQIEERIRQIQAQIDYPDVEYYNFWFEGSVIEGLETYAEAEGADLVAMVTHTHRKNLFQRIFYPSMTGKMAALAHLPLLAVPTV